MQTKRTCPECNLVFEPPHPEPTVLTCPLCDTAFTGGTPTLPMAVARVPAPTAASSATRQVLKGCLAIAVLLFLVGGLVYGYRRVTSLEPAAAPPAPPAVAAPEAPEEPVVVEVLPAPPAPPPPAIRPRVPPRPAIAMEPPELPRELGPPPSLSERVNLAIERGVAHLRINHGGHEQYRNYLALLGLTLLECGAPADDPSVRQIAAWLRTRQLDLATNYELSLAILFLDRLNEPGDRPLIRTFGQRLLAGQLECGAWSYTCPVTDKPRRPSGQTKHPYQGPQIISRKHSVPLRHLVVYQGDNSNTQFAILGLWVAQRHGVAVRSALLATEQYFRQTQSADGSWGYHPRAGGNRDSMTCAGLMSLAMRYGVVAGQGRDIRPDHPVEVHDRAIRQGLHFLGTSLDKVLLSRGRITGVEARDPLYFLWSLERLAVIYDLQTVGERVWYPWAAEMLVQTQQTDGSWRAPYPSPVGTCFALLVLRRSNLARDLQLTVRGEPGQADRPPGSTVIRVPDGDLGRTTLQPSEGSGARERPGAR